jgi:ABC-type glycerol-3-phosphate transport system substrate-binding protein
MLWASSGNLVTFSTQITAFEWGITLVPHESGAQPVTEMFGSVNTMFKGSPDQQLAAWMFLKYMAGPDTQAQFAADTGYFPSLRSSDQSAVVQPEDGIKKLKFDADQALKQANQ